MIFNPEEGTTVLQMTANVVSPTTLIYTHLLPADPARKQRHRDQSAEEWK